MSGSILDLPIVKKLMESKEDLDPKEIQDYLCQYKKVLCTDHTKLFGFMLYLIRKNIGFNQKEMGIFLREAGKYKLGFSKSGYSKIENGLTYINFDLVFILSSKLRVDFDRIYNLYSLIIKKADKNGCYFVEPCGNLLSGTHSSFLINFYETSDSYWYTDLKDYKKYFLESDLNEINEIILDLVKDRDHINLMMRVNKQMLEMHNRRRKRQAENKKSI